MKTFTGICMLAVLLGVSSIACGQQQDDYYMAPGYRLTVAVDNSIDLSLIELDVDGMTHQPLADAEGWTINGKDSSELDPSEGKFRTGMPPTTGTYTAPHTVPKVNPVAVALSFHPTRGSKTKETVVCNITVVDRSNNFQISGRGGSEDSFQLDDRFSAPAVRNMLAHAAIAGPELMVNVSAMQPGGAGGGVKSHSNGTMCSGQPGLPLTGGMNFKKQHQFKELCEKHTIGGSYGCRSRFYWPHPARKSGGER